MSNINTLADRYGEINDQIKSLQTQLKSVHSEIISTGLPKISGEHYLIKVTLRKNTELSEEKLMKVFGMTLAQYKAALELCKIEKEPSTVVNCDSLN